MTRQKCVIDRTWLLFFSLLCLTSLCVKRGGLVFNKKKKSSLTHGDDSAKLKLNSIFCSLSLSDFPIYNFWLPAGRQGRHNRLKRAYMRPHLNFIPPTGSAPTWITCIHFNMPPPQVQLPHCTVRERERAQKTRIQEIVTCGRYPVHFNWNTMRAPLLTCDDDA